MNPFSQFSLGVRTWFKAIGFIFRNKLAWFFLFPLAFNIALILGGMKSVTVALEMVMGLLQPYIGFEEANFWGSDFLKDYLPGIVQGFLYLVFKVVVFVIFAWFGGYIVLILMSPILAILSEKTEQILTGNDYPFDLMQMIRDAWRGVLIALRNMAIELVWAIGLFVLSFVPVVGLVSPFVAFGVSSYFYGFSSMDYYNERRRMTTMESVRFVRRFKWLAIANGATFAVCLLIPFCGTSLAGFAIIVSCVAATLAMHNVVDEKGLGNLHHPVPDAPLDAPKGLKHSNLPSNTKRGNSSE